MPGVLWHQKRKRNANDGRSSRAAAKRARFAVADTPDKGLREGASVRERARPFLLAVAEMPLDVLHTTWTIGRNRQIDTGHVDELREAFKKGGLERRAPENRIAVLCSAEEVRRARAASIAPDDGNDDGDRDGKPSFVHWADVNRSKVEVMDGQHRIEALREYVKEARAPDSELWWTCEIYDKDHLPRDLNIKLRVNRRDPSLPDNHGQIWTQLVSIASPVDDDEDAAGEQVGVDIKTVEMLRLGGEKQFPTRRLVTLWNHRRWRPITTRWCRTRLGLETFNISSFESMASLRIDEYLMATLEAVLATLAALPLDEGCHLTQRDWDRLSVGLGHAGRTAADVEAVFHDGRRKGRKGRSDGLLATLDDDSYASVCEYVKATPALAFTSLRRLLRTKKPDMQAAVHVLQHTIAWIDRDSALAIDEVNPKSKNKPLVREHLSTALNKLATARGREAGHPQRTAVHLQARVLDYVRDNLDEFRALPTPLDNARAALVDKAAYAQRFAHVVWARLLRVVRQVTDANGEVLHPDWRAELAPRRDGRLGQVSTLVQGFCARLASLADPPDNASLLEMQARIEEIVGEHMGVSSSGADSLPRTATYIPDSQDASMASPASQSQATVGASRLSRKDDQADEGSIASRSARRPLSDEVPHAYSRVRGETHPPPTSRSDEEESPPTSPPPGQKKASGPRWRQGRRAGKKWG
ncbi:hypothetical protein CMUS01_15976 [Colletotrichum musicola]|uniref:Uncharacterized protein n=1 Tax=Colletotrichum musicola TaxID=2175873 RepID=A0A8H6ISS1_9PEZI|nr:hypothetical protein CMUS01_15976 [Colletotrichum musicola]